MWYSEIDPSTIRVFTKIDEVRGPHRSQILANWHFTGGADLAVTLLGPHLATELGPQARRPQPGKGIVLFGSRDAVEIAEHRDCERGLSAEAARLTWHAGHSASGSSAWRVLTTGPYSRSLAWSPPGSRPTMSETSALGLEDPALVQPSVHLSHALPYLGCIPAVLVLICPRERAPR